MNWKNKFETIEVGDLIQDFTLDYCIVTKIKPATNESLDEIFGKWVKNKDNIFNTNQTEQHMFRKSCVLIQKQVQ